jgi:hypothetical protein
VENTVTEHNAKTRQYLKDISATETLIRKLEKNISETENQFFAEKSKLQTLKNEAKQKYGDGIGAWICRLFAAAPFSQIASLEKSIAAATP